MGSRLEHHYFILVAELAPGGAECDRYARGWVSFPYVLSNTQPKKDMHRTTGEGTNYLNELKKCFEPCIFSSFFSKRKNDTKVGYHH